MYFELTPGWIKALTSRLKHMLLDTDGRRFRLLQQSMRNLPAWALRNIASHKENDEPKRTTNRKAKAPTEIGRQ